MFQIITWAVSWDQTHIHLIFETCLVVTLSHIHIPLITDSMVIELYCVYCVTTVNWWHVTKQYKKQQITSQEQQLPSQVLSTRLLCAPCTLAWNIWNTSWLFCRLCISFSSFDPPVECPFLLLLNLTSSHCSNNMLLEFGCALFICGITSSLPSSLINSCCALLCNMSTAS